MTLDLLLVSWLYFLIFWHLFRFQVGDNLVSMFRGIIAEDIFKSELPWPKKLIDFFWILINMQVHTHKINWSSLIAICELQQHDSNISILFCVYWTLNSLEVIVNIIYLIIIESFSLLLFHYDTRFNACYLTLFPYLLAYLYVTRLLTTSCRCLEELLLRKIQNWASISKG